MATKTPPKKAKAASKPAKKTPRQESKKPVAKAAEKSPSRVLVPPPAAFSARDLKALDGVLKELNKGQESAVFKTAADELLSDVSFYFETGCPTLDLACGGGFPVGRVTEIFGKKASGKSTIVQHAIVEAVKKGHIVLYIDTEHAVNRDRLRHFGLDEDALVHMEPQFLEDTFELLFRFIKKIRDTAELAAKPILVVWDTIVFTPARIEVAVKGDKKYDEGEVKTDGMVKTQRAKLIRSYMSHLLDLIARMNVAFIFVNHITDKIGALFPGQYDKPGGTATEFAASVQILVKQDNSVKMMDGEDQVGSGVKFKIEKTRVSIPKKEVSARLNWFTGIDVPMTVLDYLKDRGLATKDGARYQIPSPSSHDTLVITSGEAGERSFKEAWDASPELREYILGVMEADFNRIIPWKQPQVEPIEEGAAAETAATELTVTDSEGEERPVDIFSA